MGLVRALPAQFDVPPQPGDLVLDVLVGDVRHQRQFPVGEPDPLLGLFPLGDVADDRPHPLGAPVLVHGQCGPELHQDECTISPAVFLLVDFRVPQGQDLRLDQLPFLSVPSLRCDVQVRHLGQFFIGVTKHLPERPVVLQDTPVHVNPDERVHHAVVQVPVAAFGLAKEGVEGVIVAQGSRFGGWSLYAKHAKLRYCYNLGGLQRFYVESAEPMAPGEHQVRMEFAYAGGGLGKGAAVRLYVDGTKVGEGAIPATLPMVYSCDDGCDVGEDSGAPVSPEYKAGDNRFNGEIKAVQLAIADAAENASHLVKAEDAIRMAMARQ